MENAHDAGRKQNKGRKGQMSMLVLVLGVLFFMMLAIFLFANSIKPKDVEYSNLYVHNLLLSSLRSTTGYNNPCLTVSDTLSCAYLTPERYCSEYQCSELASNVTRNAIEKVIKPTFDYFLVVEPENWGITGGERIEVGNPAVEHARPKYTANEKILIYGSNLRIVLMMANKK